MNWTKLPSWAISDLGQHARAPDSYSQTRVGAELPLVLYSVVKVVLEFLPGVAILYIIFVDC
jgi:hypothetical protein